MAYFKLLLRIGIKTSLVFVAMGEAALIYVADFSDNMFDVMILSLAMGMTIYCLVRAIRNYSSDIIRLGL